MRLLKRLLQRLLVFGLGVTTVWLIVFVVFRSSDHRLPWVLALGVGVAGQTVAGHCETRHMSRRANACQDARADATDGEARPESRGNWPEE